MAKGKNVKKITREQRQTRTYRIIIIVVSAIVLHYHGHVSNG